jgi:hypothetical protein
MVEQGKMSQSTFDEWEKDTPTQLPDRLGKTKTPKVRSVDDLHTEYRKRFGLK